MTKDRLKGSLIVLGVFTGRYSPTPPTSDQWGFSEVGAKTGYAAVTQKPQCLTVHSSHLPWGDIPLPLAEHLCLHISLPQRFHSVSWHFFEAGAFIGPIIHTSQRTLSQAFQSESFARPDLFSLWSNFCSHFSSTLGNKIKRLLTSPILK